MSVMCQNFVQNAWKKDLCSNCFKSVGDHQPYDDKAVEVLNANGYSNELSIDESPMPQTTWRTLTTQKFDSKSSQPFRLQTGFQGKILTINNTTVFQKKCQSPAFAKSTDENEKTSKNGIHIEEKQSHSKSCNGVAVAKNQKLNTPKNGILSSIETNGHVQENYRVQRTVPLQGILKKPKTQYQNGGCASIIKKSVSTVTNSTRRVSNVGFREEEPIVIGYGGRDFAPEDLEWEGASSSSDGECGAASFDENEDDKKFYAKTKENTEYNSNIGVNGLSAGHEKNTQINKQLLNVTTHSSKNKGNCVEATASINNDKASKKLYNGDELTSETDLGVLECKEDRKATQFSSLGDVNKRNDIENGAAFASGYVRGGKHQNRNSDCAPRQDTSESSEFSDDVAADAIDIIHEAINTTLTTRHRCMDNKDEDAISSDDVFVDQEVARVSVTSTATSNDPNETVMESDYRDEPLSSSMKPRVSFLHGTGSGFKQQPPSAIYAPGTNFFGSARSSTSSSSEDQTRSQDSLQSSHNDQETNPTHHNQEEDINDDEGFDNVTETNEANDTQVTVSTATSNWKPKLPAKPSKPPVLFRTRVLDSKHYAKPNTKPVLNEKDTTECPDVYYSDSENGGDDSRNTNHYAEVNIYQEINGKVNEYDDQKDEYGRQTKLEALAVELEKARHSQCNGKRQAPAPPRIPDNPPELPPSPSPLDRKSSPDPYSPPVAVFKGDSIPFSSASSTASSSSQDDAVFGSWTLHGDDNPKSSKWKNSFLAAQYSKCKMLAMSYNDDRFKPKKKFSLKKLLKLRKDSEYASSENRSSNLKAWKYSDSFDRPRAKLEIIHPMDLETKSLTVNPGFDPVTRSTSVSSFTSGVEVIAIRNSASSDYGGYYSDTMVPCHQEQNGEGTYDYVTPEQCDTNINTSSSNTDGHPGLQPRGSISPTPSRCSANSQASTLTSGSSKNGSSGSSTTRPPKPPPPPRGHSSLLLNNQKNDSTKVTVTTTSELSDRITVLPQAPKRLFRNPKSEYANFDDKTSSTIIDCNENKENPDCDYEFVQVEDRNKIHESYDVVPQRHQIESASEDKSAVSETAYKTVPAKTKQTLITKAPMKPPPIYSKLPNGGFVIKEDPWKTLEGSYTAISANNREILQKLVEQGTKERPCLSSAFRNQLQWDDIKLETKIAATFFSFGETVVYEAELPKNRDMPVTLILNLQHQPNPPELTSPSNLKYPCLGNFFSSIPGHLVLEDSRTDLELETIPGFVHVLCKSTVTTIEKFILVLPEVLTEELEKELCLILLQIIQELKGLQAQGIEEIEPSFHNILLTKPVYDNHYTLVFLSTNSFEDNGNAYSLMADDCKLSLCQYALVLISQIFKIECIEDLSTISKLKFTNSGVGRVFENVVHLLIEEKAVSLSQAKMLLECSMWGIQTLIQKTNFDLKEADTVLHRWINIERSNLIKHLINHWKEITPYLELQAQFLIRCNIKNIKDVISYL